MGKDSKIEWTDHTFNPWWGCVEVSPACAHCYAKAFAKRTGWDVWGPDKPRRLFSGDHWLEPLKWDLAAAQARERHRVFSGSMCDIFEAYEGPSMADLMGARIRLFDLILKTPHLQWLLLTKRPENMVPYTCTIWPNRWPPNVTPMTTVENQQQADIRIPELLKVPARTRGLSMEPLLSHVDLDPYLWTAGDKDEAGCRSVERSQSIDWVIAGGESGPGARPTAEAWFTELRDQCDEAHVSYFFKQWGDWKDGKRVGKKQAGRVLSGREWNEVPEF